MYLFNEDIGSWDDWGRVFQSIAVFEPLVGAIMKEEIGRASCRERVYVLV